MAPAAQSLSSLSNATPAPVDRAKQLAAILLSERGEASGAQVARELHQMQRLLDASDRHRFQRYLASEFQPDKAALRTPAERYLADPTAESAAALAQAADPPRQEVLRRMNMASGGTGALIAMRSELIAYEAVHEIKGRDDLRRRLAPDRRCFAFFHPALRGEPLIFVEVALVQGSRQR